NKLTAMEADYDKAKKDIAKLTKEKSDLEKKMAGMEEKVVSLDPIVVTPSLPVVTSPAATETKEPLRGRVLVVNREYSFVVTDLGQKDGITPGMVFELRDGEVLLAKSEIEKVYDTMSSATLMPGADLSKIKKGNLVIESQ
ncbi:MAG: hypothetical protein QGI05_00205, partial [Candidatus Omnitrophota bacterium]|nr:hypothetical protein [Candidatus Omnitrophota bacterium]